MSTSPRRPDESPSGELRLQSAAVRLQRLGLPQATFRVLGRIGASLAVSVGITGLLSLIGTHDGPFIAMAVLTLFAAAISFVALLPLGVLLTWTTLAAVFSRTAPGTVRVAGGMLRVESRRSASTFSCADVASVHAEDPDWPSVAVIRFEDGDELRVATTGTDQVTALANAIATGDPAGPSIAARGERPWASPLYAPVLAPSWPRHAVAAALVLAAVAMLALAWGPAAISSFIGATGALLWLTVLRPKPLREELRVGVDGVAVRTEMGTRFIAYSRIAKVVAEPYGAALTLTDGQAVYLSVWPSSLARDKAWAPALDLAGLRRDTLLQHIARGRSEVEPVAGEERVARQGRSIDAWRIAMRDLVCTDAVSYRAAVLPEEQAARIVESGHAAPEARIGAALALASSTNYALKQRLRIALQASVDDGTRKAIHEALEDRLELWRLDVIEERCHSTNRR